MRVEDGGRGWKKVEQSEGEWKRLKDSRGEWIHRIRRKSEIEKSSNACKSYKCSTDHTIHRECVCRISFYICSS